MSSSVKYPKNQSEPHLEGNMKSLYQIEDVTRWSPRETLLWLLNNINCRAEELAVMPLDKVAGKRALDVLRITREDFTKMIPGCGQHIYDLFQSKFQAEGYESYDTILDGIELDRENAKMKKTPSRNADVDPKFVHDVFLELKNNMPSIKVEEIKTLKLEIMEKFNYHDLKRLSLEECKKLLPAYGESVYYILQKKFNQENHKEESYPLDQRTNEKLKKNTSADVDSKFLQDVFLELKNNIPSIKVEEIAKINFEIMGKFNYHDFKRLSLEECKKLLPAYGESMYYIMQKKFNQENNKEKSYKLVNNYPLGQHTNAVGDDCNSDTSIDSTKPTVEEKRKRGRPRGSTKRNKPERRVGHVWEFLLELLLSPDCGHIVSWQNRETGVFMFNDSKRLAQLWGEHRNNPKMTFGKFSRSIRHNYKKGYLLPVPKRLVYKFGPKSKGWQLMKE